MKRHLFHLVGYSAWPFISAFFLFFFTTSLAFVAHRMQFGFFIFCFAVLLLVYMSRQWLFDVEDEASLFGYHTLVIKKGLYRGFILFVVSEVMLFFGFFWAFFHFALSPSHLFALIWPYDNAFVVVNCLGFPAYNTMLLMVSGMTVTYAHYALASSRQHEALDALYLTVFLGLLFLISQINEYFEIAYNLNDSSYSCVFYMLTGLHGMHVFMGVSFLYVCLESLCLQDFTMNHYLGFVCAIWYWHFVDAVWILLFICVYAWGFSNVSLSEFVSFFL